MFHVVNRDKNFFSFTSESFQYIDGIPVCGGVAASVVSLERNRLRSEVLGL